MTEYAIETKQLTKLYGEEVGVNNLNLHVEHGKIYGLLGRNGAGKTTTMRMLLNLVNPTDGKIYLFGEDYKNCPAKIFRKIGSIIETPGFYENLTARENLQILAMLRGKHRKDSIDNALRIVGLLDETKKVFSDYSLGMKQRLGIAAAIMHEPELLILDEPINGLDPIGIHEIRNFLLSFCKEKGTTILISSHVLSEIEQLADVIGVMHEGRLIEEVDMKELHKRNRQYVEFRISNENMACVLLEKHFNINDYTVHENNTIRIYYGIEKRGEINRCFVDNGLLVTKMNINEEKLEEYFSNLIGGGKIG
ncbi:ABC transporter ATP-binding protein [Clostridium sp. D2Q-14]|uniref:ABC transporter ATP-binding protein n=1 Tax=Anaeromonas gelatinilytica TaxID=2683194 RepID=UPI00193B5B0E|nr:ABC transporter ATP-binding protein [Anaeromonas gelatinilytica]MBS4536297.1 ABC transporter ATP-binding protein [Anaeromonas gelatinilytica]